MKKKNAVIALATTGLFYKIRDQIKLNIRDNLELNWYKDHKIYIACQVH